MSSDERITRLTELARRVWPDAAEVELASYGAESAPASIVWSHEDQLVRIEHPRALDALEAALLVLAGGDVLESAYRPLELQRAMERHEDRAWVEELAASWERLAEADKQARGKGYIETEYATACRENAAELRARARSK